MIVIPAAKILIQLLVKSICDILLEYGACKPGWDCYRDILCAVSYPNHSRLKL